VTLSFGYTLPRHSVNGNQATKKYNMAKANAKETTTTKKKMIQQRKMLRLSELQQRQKEKTTVIVTVQWEKEIHSKEQEKGTSVW